MRFLVGACVFLLLVAVVNAMPNNKGKDKEGTGGGDIIEEIPHPDPGIPSDSIMPTKNGQPTGRGWVKKVMFDVREANYEDKKNRPKHSKLEGELQEQEFEFMEWKKDFEREGRPPPVNKKINKYLKEAKLTISDMENAIKGKKSGDRDKGKGRKKRTAIYGTQRRWTKCIVPYVYDESFDDRTIISEEKSNASKTAIEDALNQYRKLSAFRFVKYTGNNSEYCLDHVGYLRFIVASGCWSLVGNLNKSDGQPLSACTGNIAIHEVGHALGLMHEQQHPMSMEWLRVNFQEIQTYDRVEYYRQTLADLFNENKLFYDVSTIMQYETWGFNLNYQPTMSFYDEDDEYYFHVPKSYYYMFRDLQIWHKCFDEYPACATHPTCLNGGYLSVIDNQCNCRCPRGLDMKTNCATELPQLPTTWPKGQYTILKSTLSDCPAGWEAGMMVHKNGPGIWEGYLYHSPGYNASILFHDVCTKTDTAGTKQWPSGEYCILRYNHTCPAGFEVGTLKTYGTETTENNTGTLPDGPKDRDFHYIYCCRTDGSEGQELEGLEFREPFILFPTNWACQTVRDMISFRESIIWRNEGSKTIVMEGKLPKIYKFTDYMIKMYYCVYFPVTTGACGEIKKFTADEKTYTFHTMNYPNNMNSSHECIWRFESPPNTIMQLDFNDFSVPESGGSCKSYVELKDWLPEIGGFKFCGSSYQKTRWTKSNFMALTVWTDREETPKGFNATITILPENDKRCYQGDGSKAVYSGKVNYGKNFDSCLPWDEVLNCPFHAFDAKTAGEDLTGHNYCRNVGIGQGPWCYKTSDNCQRQLCDACQLGSCYDVFDDCATTIANDADFCNNNEFGNAARGCRRSCGLCVIPTSGEHAHMRDGELHCQCCPYPVTCPEPESVSGIRPASTKTVYQVGDTVNYQCPTTNVVVTRTCTSEGTWTDLKSVCGVCPAGWIPFQMKCYKWLGHQVQLTHEDAKAACAAQGARLPKPLNGAMEMFLDGVLDYDVDDPNSIWIGVHKNSSGQWVWNVDGKTTEYSDWDSGYPWSGSWGGHDCAVLVRYWVESESIFNVVWVSTYCTNVRYTICELELPDGNNAANCIDQRSDCSATLLKHGDACCVHTDYAWHNCRQTCGIGVCKNTSVTCIDDASLGASGKRTEGGLTVGHGEYVGYVCNSGYHHTLGNLKRACLSTGQLTGTAPVCTAISSLDSYAVNEDLFLKKHGNVGEKRRIVTSNSRSMVIPVAGVIKSWTFYSNLVGEMAFLVIRPTNRTNMFNVVGVNTINRTSDDRIMKVEVPTNERFTVAPNDQIGIYHKDDEIGFMRCNPTVMPQHSNWVRSSNERSGITDMPGWFLASYISSEWSCRIYALQYEMDPQ